MIARQTECFDFRWKQKKNVSKLDALTKKDF